MSAIDIAGARLKLPLIGAVALLVAGCGTSSQIPIPEIDRSSEPTENPLEYLRVQDPAASEHFFETNKHLFDYDQSIPVDVQEVSRRTEGGLEVIEITYDSPMGGRVPAKLIVPNGSGSFAGIVMMRSMELEFAKKYADFGAVVLFVDPPSFRPQRGGPRGILIFTEQDRDEQIQLIIDLRRGIDLLTARPDVDPQRLAYLGVSYGGAMGGLLAGVEHRLQALVLVVGNGGLVTHMTSPENRTTTLAEFFERYSEWIDEMWPIEPIHYVGQASPVPLLFQNMAHDQYVNVEDAIRYQEVGSEPKLVLWYDSNHWPLPEDAIIDNATWLQQFIGSGRLYLLPSPNYRESAIATDRLIMICLVVMAVSIVLLIWRLRRRAV